MSVIRIKCIDFRNVWEKAVKAILVCSFLVVTLYDEKSNIMMKIISGINYLRYLIVIISWQVK